MVVVVGAVLVVAVTVAAGDVPGEPEEPPPDETSCTGAAEPIAVVVVVVGSLVDVDVDVLVGSLGVVGTGLRVVGCDVVPLSSSSHRTTVVDAPRSTSSTA